MTEERRRAVAVTQAPCGMEPVARRGVLASTELFGCQQCGESDSAVSWPTSNVGSAWSPVVRNGASRANDGRELAGSWWPRASGSGTRNARNPGRTDRPVRRTPNGSGGSVLPVRATRQRSLRTGPGARGRKTATPWTAAFRARAGRQVQWPLGGAQRDLSRWQRRTATAVNASRCLDHAHPCGPTCTERQRGYQVQVSNSTGGTSARLLARLASRRSNVAKPDARELRAR